MKNKLKWYYNRLKLMSVKEILYFRLPQFLQSYVFGHFQANRKLSIFNTSPIYKAPVYSLSTLKTLFKADDFNTKYSFFNTSIDVFKISDWRKDYLNNKTSPISYYNTINRQNFDVVGDVKFVSEPARLQFLPFLAFKGVESNELKYEARITTILKDWQTQNPYLKSIHWTSGIEIGIRSVNLIYTHVILSQFEKLSIECDFLIRTQLTNNYNYLKRHLSLFSSANNHLMAELMGLVVVSSYLEVSIKEQNKWQDLFFNEILNQVNPDGVHMELCTRYHAEVTDQILIGLSFLKNKGFQIPDTIELRFRKMFEFTEHVSYRGVDTVFGDNDEGFVIDPYFESGFSLYKSQLLSSNYLYQTNFYAEKTSDFRNYLIFGEGFKVTTNKNLPESRLFKQSGYCFMYDHESELKLSFDVGEIGDAISAAHGHSDLHHFTLQQHDKALIVDPGTYQYHTKDAFWRNYFRGISAHNTISINNQHHAVMNNRMSWIETPDMPYSEFQITEHTLSCKGKHNAFIALGTTHERSITLDKENKKVIVIDVLTNNSSEKNTASFYLHFHSDATVSQHENEVIISKDNLSIQISNTNFIDANIIRGDINEPFGWFSESYNLKTESQSLRLNLELKNKLTLETSITYE